MSDAPRTPWWQGLVGRQSLLVVALVAIALIFQFLTSGNANSFLSAWSVSTVLKHAAVIGTLACGMTFIILLTHIDLSVGSAVAFLGAIAAWLMAAPPAASSAGMLPSAGGLGWSAWLALPLICVGATLLWAGKGLLQQRTGMPAFIITLGGMMGYRGLTLLVAEQEIQLPHDHPLVAFGHGAVPAWGTWALMGVLLAIAGWRWRLRRRLRAGPAWPAALPWALVAVVLLAVELPGVAVAPGLPQVTLAWGLTVLFCVFIAHETVLGRHIYATGGNREAAALCGIRVERVNILVFAGMGLVTAMAALIYLAQQGSATSSAGQLLELDAIAACVLGGVSLMGGKGSIVGAALGALIMQTLTDGLIQCNVSTGYQMIIKAAVLIGVVALDHGLRRRG